MISAGQLFAISTIAYLCGLSVLSGFALQALYKLYIKPGTGGRLGSIAWTFFACAGMAASTLGTIFSFILLVLPGGSDGILIRATIFVLALATALVFSFSAAISFNKALKDGRISIKHQE